MKKYILIIILISILPFLLNGQELRQHLEKPSKLFVGTPFQLHIEITASPGDSIYAPQLDSLDVFFIMNEPEQSEVIENDLQKNLITLTFQAFDTGEYNFPQLEFLVKNETGDHLLQTREFVVIINSVLPDSADVIKDIAKPFALKLGFWDYFIPILALIILIIIIRLITKLLKRPEREITQPEIVDSRPPYIIARIMLDDLLAEKLLENGKFLEFYYRLSLILRFFIEKFYQINALEMTTSEIRYYLKLSDAQEKSDIMRLLTESDKVKFARFIPDRRQAEDFVSWLDTYLLAFKQRQPEVKDA